MRRGFVSAGGRTAAHRGAGEGMVTSHSGLDVPSRRANTAGRREGHLACRRARGPPEGAGGPDRWGADAGVGLNPGAWFAWGLMRPLPSTLFTRTPELEGG